MDEQVAVTICGKIPYKLYRGKWRRASKKRWHLLLLPNHTCQMIANRLKFRVFPRPGQDLGPPKSIAIATL